MAGDGWGYPLPWTEGRRRPLEGLGPPKQWRTRYELEVGVATEKGQRTRKVSTKGRPAVLKALEQRLVRAIPLVRAVVLPLPLPGGGGATAAAEEAKKKKEEEEEEEEEAKKKKEEEVKKKKKEEEAAEAKKKKKKEEEEEEEEEEAEEQKE
eukprot:COSAG05_NODE_631_length_8203_cov_23.575148_1_plen_151_part_10